MLTDREGSMKVRTKARLSVVSVRIVSVRPCWNILVSAVSYVAVNTPRDWYQDS